MFSVWGEIGEKYPVCLKKISCSLSKKHCGSAVFNFNTTVD